MRKLLFISICMNLCILLPLVSCTAEGSHVEIKPTLPSATLSPTPVTLLQSTIEITSVIATPMPESELINVPTLEPPDTTTPTATSTMAALPHLTNATISPLVCSEVKSFINIQQKTNNVSRRLMDFVFEQEDALTFLMWSDRPYLDSTPTPPTGLPTELGRSHRVLLKGQTWDLNNGQLVESSITEQNATQNPCDQNCLLEVVSIAPDNNWQLLQITTAPADYQGLWLVNQKTVQNLVPYVPPNSKWRWSNDSHMLWLTYTLVDISGESYGSESMVVDLTVPDSAQIVFQSWDVNQAPNLLSPDEYDLVFSPTDKTVLSYEHIGSSDLIPPDNQLDVHIIDVAQNPPQLLDTYQVHYPFLIDWSDTLQDFLILELDTTGASIYTLSNDVVYEIPMVVLKQMPEVLGMDGQFRKDFSDEVDVISLNINLERIAISPTLEHVVLMSRNRAWAFSCSD